MATQTLIKNIHLVNDILKPDELEKMEQAAIAHRRYSNLSFKIKELTDKRVIFQVGQGKSAAENYFNQKRMGEIVKETFGRFFPGRIVIGHGTPYVKPDPEIVDSKWVSFRMQEHSIKLKTIADESGIDYSQLSWALTEDRELSKPMKAFFWYYFLSKTPASKGK